MSETVCDESGAPKSRALYGRVKGKTLRAHQAGLLAGLLPSLEAPEAVADLAALFGRPMRQFRLEIGFGAGEHLIARARENPDVGFIGCEPFVNGVAKLVGAIAEHDLDNVRLRSDDATGLIAAAPEAAFARIYLLYPDPWPKRRHNKRRFVTPQSLAALARVLEPGGELRFATDIDDYAGWTLTRALASPFFAWDAGTADDWRRPWPGWSPTRYETKARAAGRPSAYLTFRRC